MSRYLPTKLFKNAKYNKNTNVKSQNSNIGNVPTICLTKTF